VTDTHAKALDIFKSLILTPNGRYFLGALVFWVGSGAGLYYEVLTFIEAAVVVSFGMVPFGLSALFAWKAGEAENHMAIRALDLKARKELHSDKTVFKVDKED